VLLTVGESAVLSADAVLVILGRAAMASPVGQPAMLPAGDVGAFERGVVCMEMWVEIQ